MSRKPPYAFSAIALAHYDRIVESVDFMSIPSANPINRSSAKRLYSANSIFRLKYMNALNKILQILRIEF